MKKNNFNFLIAFFSLILIMPWVSSAPSFFYYENISYTTEGISGGYFYNFTANVTNSGNEALSFSIRNITWNMNTSSHTFTNYNWMSFGTSNGTLFINTTRDNETGRFNFSMEVLSGTGGEIRNFYFIVNATNDAPAFTNISLEYNLTQGTNFFKWVNATDEEGHYPLFFNITFLTNCSHANWTTRSNCSLFNLTNIVNSSAIMNFTPTRSDVGVYTLNFSVMDAGEKYNCSSGYCASDYSNNITTNYSGFIKLNVFALLDINVSDCEGKVFQENSSNYCIVNISSTGSADSLNVTTYGFLRNSASTTIVNRTWFYNSSGLLTSSAFLKSIMINFTPQKTEIGNWTINLNLSDVTSSATSSQQIHVYVNRTLNDVPEFAPIQNTNTSINLSTRINFTIYDDDLMIPDKNSVLGGYNETINFTVIILNQSDITQQLNSINNFTVQIVSAVVSGTNRTTAKIDFTPNSTSFGNYTINITARDFQNRLDSEMFNFSIKENSAPVWGDVVTTHLIYENNNTYFNLSMNVSDSDSDNLTFSYTNSTSFSSFVINSTTGIINFTPVDLDVGEHIIIIGANDGYLTSYKTFNFTIYNFNDVPYIEYPILASDVANASVDSGSNINCSEDNRTTINLWVQDDDFKILSNQKDFYNESLSMNLTIQGVNSSLFNLTFDRLFPVSDVGDNRSKYGTTFTPKKADVGKYNITITVTDKFNYSSTIVFNLTVISKEHDPILMNIGNKTSAINRTFNYQFNASDIENGYSNSTANINFTLSYNFTSGSDFIKNNESIFNKSTGLFNINFNSTQGGVYRINITVNDSSDRKDSEEFWMFVHNNPTLTYPAVGYSYYLTENSSYNFTFASNNSVNTNITYLIYLQNWNNEITIIKNITYLGNNSNMSFLYTPGFGNETNGIKDLSIFAYPSDSDLENKIDLNTTSVFSITINHTNYPLGFSGYIGGINQKVTGAASASFILSDYFSDFDASDSLYNQSVGFTYVQTHSSGGAITVNIINWTNRTSPNITFSATASGTANYTITGFEFNESNSSQIIGNVSSNNFSVELTISTTTETVQTSGGGGGDVVEKAISFKIIAPPSILANPYSRLDIPLTIKNTGKKEFSGITLIGSVFKDGISSSSVDLSFDKASIGKIDIDKEEKVMLILYFNTNRTGNYEIVLNGTSNKPVYTDWAKINVNLQRVNETELKKYLLFVDEYISQNNDCRELKEYLKEATNSFDAGDYPNSRLKAEQAVNSCKKIIAEKGNIISKIKVPKIGMLGYLIIATAVAFLAGILYYYIKRERIRTNAVMIYDEAKI